MISSYRLSFFNIYHYLKIKIAVLLFIFELDSYLWSVKKNCAKRHSDINVDPT